MYIYDTHRNHCVSEELHSKYSGRLLKVPGDPTQSPTQFSRTLGVQPCRVGKGWNMSNKKGIPPAGKGNV